MSAFPGAVGAAASIAAGPNALNPAIPAQTGNVGTPVVIIDIGTVTPDDTSAQYNDAVDTQPSEQFTDYVIENRYEYDPHSYMGGMSSPGGLNGQSVAFFQLSNATLLWLADWTAKNWGVDPQKPDPYNLEDSNWVFLGAIAETRSVDVGADGITPVYRISGTYVYGYSNPTTAFLQYLRYGRPAYLMDGSIARTVGNTAKNLMDGKGGGGVAGAGGASPGSPGMAGFTAAGTP
jgi:hypothetical protein